MRPLRLHITVVAALVLGLGGWLARPAMAADWTLAPADNQFGPGRQSFGYTLNPGARLHDGLVVANAGSSPLRLALHAADAWVHPADADVTVPPGRSVEVPFAVTLPDDAKPGDYMSAIVTSADGTEVRLPVRLRVGGALKPSLAIEDVRVHDTTVTYTVRNTGNATLAARRQVSVSGPFGRWAKDAGKLPDVPALLPGATWEGSAHVPGVPPSLRLTATVRLMPLLTDAAGSTAPLATVETSGHGWAVPWPAVVPPIVLLGLVVATLTIRSRRRRRPLRVAR